MSDCNYNLESNISTCVCLTYRCVCCHEFLDNCDCECDDCEKLIYNCICGCSECGEMLKNCKCICCSCGSLTCIFTCEYCDKQYIGICCSDEFFIDEITF